MCSDAASLTACVDALAAVDVTGLPVSRLQELIETGAGAANRLGGIVSRAVAELHVRGGGLVPDADQSGATCPTPAWLRTVTRTTGSSAGSRIRTSVRLRELPAVADAIVDGLLTDEHGRQLARLVGKIDPAALLRSQPELIEVARRTDPQQLASYVSHLLATWCEPDLAAEEEAAEDRAFLQLRDTDRGSVRGSFEVPHAGAEVIRTVLETLARRDGDSDTRSAGRRRADALVDVFGLALRFGELPDAGGSRPVLTYVVPAWWSTVLAAAMTRTLRDPLATEQPDGAVGSLGLTPSAETTCGFTLDLDRHPGQDCASAPWTGPATRTRISTLLCDAQIQRAVLDSDGQILSLTSVTDQITNAQRRAVAARDRCCTAKGCSRPPAFCDVHHLRARADGGATSIDNLVLLCRRHHVLWHRNLLDLTDLRVPWKRLPQPRAPALE